MKHSDFKIGMQFKIAGGRFTWHVTDIGTRTIIAIKVREGWMKGPPYAQAEWVFNEDDIKVCNKVEE